VVNREDDRNARKTLRDRWRGLLLCAGGRLARREDVIISRRNFATATAAAGGMLAINSAEGAQLGNPDNPPHQAGITDNPRSGSDPGPRNQALDEQFPNDYMPPSTDHGHMDNFWFPFSAANKRVQNGGWSREVTVKQLPIAKSLAGVNMRLTAGGVREPHWHLPAEWAFDFKIGDAGYIPRAMGHYIENTGNDDLIFLEVFASSYYSTISFLQWLRHVPLDLVKAHFNFSDETLSAIPRGITHVIGS
jgi:oxalate decarboxylase